MKDFLKKNLYNITIILILAFGIFLRLKTYFYCKSFWYDEAALALNILDKSFLELLKPLDYVQCAPYLFLVISKAAISLFGSSEYTFRFLPLVFGIASIFAFYILSKKVLDKKWSILAANYLFCVNFHLIYYSSEFKQYSLEVLITILTILYLAHLDIKALNFKKSVILGILFFVSFLLSMPSGIILGAFILYLIYKDEKLSALKTALAICMPFIILFIPYYLAYLLPSKIIMINEYWQDTDIYINIKTLYFIIKHYFHFVFYPNYNPLIPITLLCCGAFLFFKRKRKTELLMLLILFTAFITSILKIYPIYDRMASYLMPLLILIIIKPVDCITFKESKKKLVFSILIIFITLLFFRMNTFKYILRFYDEDVFYKGSARELLCSVKNISKDNIFIAPKWAVPAYEYYSRQYFKEIPKLIYPKDRAETIQSLFNSIPPGKICWFYIPWKSNELNDSKVIKQMVTNRKITQILFQKEISSTRIQNKNAFIIKVKKL